ncbi:MAG: hypothetical protein WA705_19685 [Candidatus Ozemobacteraceae bacterium]
MSKFPSLFLVIFLFLISATPCFAVTEDFPMVYVEAFGAIGDGLVDDTNAVQAAIASGEGKVIAFHGEKTYSVGLLTIVHPLTIDGMGAKLIGNANAVFTVSNNLNYLHIRNFSRVTFSNTGTVACKDFFANVSDNILGGYGRGLDIQPEAAATGVYPSKNVKDLRIENCQLAYSRVYIGGASTSATISDCKWVHDSSIQVSPAYLWVAIGDKNTRSGGITIENNVFDCYPKTSGNQDIVKLEGGCTFGQILGNTFKNNNINSFAQVDVYWGGDRLRIIGNRFSNVQFHRKQTGLASVSMEMDVCSLNDFFIPKHSLINSACYLRGSRFLVNANTIKIENATPSHKRAIFLDNEDYPYDALYPNSFGTDGPCAFIISNNIMEFTASVTNSIGIEAQGAINSAEIGNGVISGNLLIGGTRFVSGTMAKIAQVGNAWVKASGYAGQSGSNIANGIAIGNVADNPLVPFNGYSSGNVGKQIFQVENLHTDSTTVALNGTSNVLRIQGNKGMISKLTGGYGGQIIHILSGASGPIIANSTATGSNGFFLNGSANFDMTTYGSSLTVIRDEDNKVWVELARSARFH